MECHGLYKRNKITINMHTNLRKKQKITYKNTYRKMWVCLFKISTEKEYWIWVAIREGTPHSLKRKGSTPCMSIFLNQWSTYVKKKGWKLMRWIWKTWGSKTVLLMKTVLLIKTVLLTEYGLLYCTYRKPRYVLYYKKSYTTKNQRIVEKRWSFFRRNERGGFRRLSRKSQVSQSQKVHLIIWGSRIQRIAGEILWNFTYVKSDDW